MAKSFFAVQRVGRFQARPNASHAASQPSLDIATVSVRSKRLDRCRPEEVWRPGDDVTGKRSWTAVVVDVVEAYLHGCGYPASGGQRPGRNNRERRRQR